MTTCDRFRDRQQNSSAPGAFLGTLDEANAINLIIFMIGSQGKCKFNIRLWNSS